jgi:hypothetical protein
MWVSDIAGPILSFKICQPEHGLVVGYEHSADRQCVGCDQEIERCERLTATLQASTKGTVGSSSLGIPGHRLDLIQKSLSRGCHPVALWTSP